MAGVEQRPGQLSSVFQLHTQREAFVSSTVRERVVLIKRPIREVEPGDNVYVDLRAWNPIWYDQLELPDAYKILHVALCQYTE